MKLVSLLICLSPLALASITIPNVYLIEFDNRTHVKRNIDQRRNQFYEQLDSLHIQYNVRHEYNLIHAVSLEFKSPRDTELFFESAMDVKRVWPVVMNYIGDMTFSAIYLKIYMHIEHSSKAQNIPSRQRTFYRSLV